MIYKLVFELTRGCRLDSVLLVKDRRVIGKY
jgi:hypothetical protein